MINCGRCFMMRRVRSSAMALVLLAFTTVCVIWGDLQGTLNAQRLEPYADLTDQWAVGSINLPVSVEPPKSLKLNASVAASDTTDDKDIEEKSNELPDDEEDVAEQLDDDNAAEAANLTAITDQDEGMSSSDAVFHRFRSPVRPGLRYRPGLGQGIRQRFRGGRFRPGARFRSRQRNFRQHRGRGLGLFNQGQQQQARRRPVKDFLLTPHQDSGGLWTDGVPPLPDKDGHHRGQRPPGPPGPPGPRRRPKNPFLRTTAPPSPLGLIEDYQDYYNEVENEVNLIGPQAVLPVPPLQGNRLQRVKPHYRYPGSLETTTLNPAETLDLDDLPHNGRGVNTQVHTKSFTKTEADSGYGGGKAYDNQPWIPVIQKQPDPSPRRPQPPAVDYDEEDYSDDDYADELPFGRFPTAKRRNEFGFYEDELVDEDYGDAKGRRRRKRRRRPHQDDDDDDVDVAQARDLGDRENLLGAEPYLYDQEHRINDDGFFDDFVVDFSDSFNVPQRVKKEPKKQRDAESDDYDYHSPKRDSSTDDGFLDYKYDVDDDHSSTEDDYLTENDLGAEDYPQVPPTYAPRLTTTPRPPPRSKTVYPYSSIMNSNSPAEPPSSPIFREQSRQGANLPLTQGKAPKRRWRSRPRRFFRKVVRRPRPRYDYKTRDGIPVTTESYAYYTQEGSPENGAFRDTKYTSYAPVEKPPLYEYAPRSPPPTYRPQTTHYLNPEHTVRGKRPPVIVHDEEFLDDYPKRPYREPKPVAGRGRPLEIEHGLDDQYEDQESDDYQHESTPADANYHEYTRQKQLEMEKEQKDREPSELDYDHDDFTAHGEADHEEITGDYQQHPKKRQRPQYEQDDDRAHSAPLRHNNPYEIVRDHVLNNDKDYYANYGEPSTGKFRYNPDDFAVDDGSWDDIFDGHRSSIDKDIESLSRNHEDYSAPEGQENASGGERGEERSPQDETGPGYDDEDYQEGERGREEDEDEDEEEDRPPRPRQEAHRYPDRFEYEDDDSKYRDATLEGRDYYDEPGGGGGGRDYEETAEHETHPRYKVDEDDREAERDPRGRRHRPPRGREPNFRYHEEYERDDDSGPERGHRQETYPIEDYNDYHGNDQYQEEPGREYRDYRDYRDVRPTERDVEAQYVEHDREAEAREPDYEAENKPDTSDDDYYSNYEDDPPPKTRTAPSGQLKQEGRGYPDDYYEDRIRQKSDYSQRRDYEPQSESRWDPADELNPAEIPGFESFFSRIEDRIEKEISDEPDWEVPDVNGEQEDKPADGVADIQNDVRPNRYNSAEASDLGFQMPSHEELQENYQTITSSESQPQPVVRAYQDWESKKLAPGRPAT